MNTLYTQYQKKLRTPEEAVKCIKSNDWVDYTSNVGFPVLLDHALSKRRDELSNVNIRGNLMFGPLEVVECDPTREHFFYNSWHFSAYERQLFDRGLCSFIPMVFRNNTWYYRNFLTVNVAMVSVTPMDKHGYFNLSCATGVALGILRKADIVIVEVNEHLPRIFGGFGEVIHLDDVDFVVEGEHPSLPQFPLSEPSAEEREIAKLLIPHIPSGASLQLGIGSLPNTIGALLAESDLKDFGMHTELCGDAYYELFQSGKLTNRYITAHPHKGMTGMVFGSQHLYDWVDSNPTVTAAPLEYVNALPTIASVDNIISINNCVAVDLYGQISSESSGFRQISGTGGQLDFLVGAAMSNGGKAFICMSSSFCDKNGVLHSRIVPSFSGDIISSPRSLAFYLATEYGCVNLAGLSTWERAEALISLAHPMFREELIIAAQKQGIWRTSSKR